ncbi:hypothetical protein H1R17_01100 [Flavobacterium sp. xlx-214]|uniref:hypothetical protein n=1 Tax=unclassified Flavobacterium TaxID=196869 RepID=UPI0013D2EE92|nr:MULTISPECIES: hypothetical protein [unclassified Flavobacterium]MBA5792616.1 hypothetical protein [Flavobacterium sp. xlx-221]QMI83765.1 hypothetical protein H1R17_01100 [Flavobacterium sp. xlx-214]
MNAKAIASISLLGMLMLFFTKWTKDDGDEMYLNFRLIAAFSGLIFGVITFVVSTWFNAFVFFDDEMELFSSSISILFMMLFQMLFIFGGKVYKAKKELKYND